MAINDQKNEQNLKENNSKKAFVILSLLAIVVIGGILMIVGLVLWTGYSPITGYTVKGLTSHQGQSLPHQGVSPTYLNNRFASMKATQAMYEASGVLEDSANSYYGVDSISGPGCKDSDYGNFYIKGTAQWGNQSMDDKCDGTDWLMEWYCDGDTGKLIRYKCPDGCVEGACN